MKNDNIQRSTDFEVALQDAKDVSIVAISHRFAPRFFNTAKTLLLKEAHQRYWRILERIGKLRDAGELERLSPINFPVIYSSSSYGIKGTQAHDPILDVHAIDSSLYYTNKFTHIGHLVHDAKHGFSYVERAVKDIFDRHGYDGALAFSQRLWDDCWIFDAPHCAELIWKLVRGKMFFLKDPMSKEYCMYCNKERYKIDSCFFSTAVLDKKSGRDPNLLIKEAATIRGDIEEKLDVARSRTTDINDWLWKIFSILPSYLAVLFLYKESYYLTRNAKLRKTLSREMRFVDERQADIATAIASTPSTIIKPYTVALAAYREGDILKARRVLEFHCEGRVCYPRSLCRELETQLGSSPREISDFLSKKLRKGLRQAFQLIRGLSFPVRSEEIVRLLAKNGVSVDLNAPTHG